MLRKSLLYIYCFCTFSVAAQVKTEKVQDSVGFYRNIEGYADKKKVTKWIHRLFFKPVPAIASKAVRKELRKVTDPYYKAFEGRIIRNVVITSLDPFGNKLKDTTVVPTGFFRRSGNVLHNKTAIRTLRNLLLFEEGDRFDSLKVRDSERLIRSQKYIRDVAFMCKRIGKSDSVDIYIRSLDVWSIIVEGSVTGSRFSPDISERNFMGLGHKVEYQYNSYFSDGDYNMFFNYNINNIYKSYINTGLYHFRDKQGARVSSISVDRAFYSPFTKWAGGAYLALQKSAPVFANEDSIEITSINSTQSDFWIGHSWKLFKSANSDARLTHLITSLRYANLNYTQIPTVNDSLNIYSNERFYLAGVGISFRKYVSDRYVFKYGDNEDVPSGKAFGFVTGYRMRDNENDWYLGGKVSWGDYYTWGYFTAVMEYGTFINKSQFNQAVATVKVKYFTDLIEVGKWRFRQFISPSLTVGINRKASEYITINDDVGISGFNSETLLGKKRLLFTFQTQSYAPWKLFGFRFGPYLVLSAGLLSLEDENLFKSRLYTQFGLGLLIKNEYLVLNTFQVSLAFYPIIPDTGNNVIKVNPLKTTDFNLWDFEFNRPAMISYQ